MELYCLQRINLSSFPQVTLIFFHIQLPWCNYLLETKEKDISMDEEREKSKIFMFKTKEFPTFKTSLHCSFHFKTNLLIFYESIWTMYLSLYEAFSI